MSTDLKLPAGISATDVRATKMLRWFFSREAEKVRRARMATAVYKPNPAYDQPESGYCVWYQWLVGYRPHVNPLWAIRCEMEAKILVNEDLNPKAILHKSRIQEYLSYGQRSMESCKIEAESSIYVLLERIPVVRLSFGLTDNASALDMVQSQSAIDPVIRLVYCDSQRIPVSTELMTLALVRWAYCPHIYSGVPQSVISKYGLQNLFGVLDDFAQAKRVGVDGLLRSIGVTDSRGEAAG